MKRAATLLCAGAVLLLCSLLIFRQPMLVQVTDGPLAPLAVPNPFRDRGPEETAFRFFRAIKTDHCEALLGSLSLAPDTAKAMCARERKSPPDEYKLQRRDDYENRTKMVFRWSIGGSHDVAGICEIDVERGRGSDWRISNYDREY